MFIQVKPDLARHAGPPAFLAAWKDTSASCQRQVSQLSHLPVDLFAVVPVIGEGRMDISQGQPGKSEAISSGALA